MTTDTQTLLQSVEGIYEYAEARRGASVFKPPEIGGRFVMLKGTMILIATNRSDPCHIVDSAQYGSYTLTDNVFVYEWEYRKGFTQSTQESLVMSRLTFDGQRRFSVLRSDDAIRMVSEIPKQSEFRFLTDRLEYFENEDLMRVWRRV